MRTRSEGGELYGPVRLLEMLEFRFGAFETIASASLELARAGAEDVPPMDEKTADAVLEFADDLRLAYEVALIWENNRAITRRESGRLSP